MIVVANISVEMFGGFCESSLVGITANQDWLRALSIGGQLKTPRLS